MRIVVFLPNLIGDTVMATPTLRALRQQFPDAHLAGVIKPSVAPTLHGSAWLDQTILHDPRSTDRSRRFLGLIWKLRKRPFDVAVLLPNSFRSALQARLGGARRIVGYDRGGRGFLLNDRLTPPRSPNGRFEPTPVVNYYLALAHALGCPTDSRQLELFTTEKEEAAADQAWERLRLAGRSPLVCLNTGGAFGPAKNWPVDHFVRLARRLADQARATVVVLCGPAERSFARSIAKKADHPSVLSLADERPSLGLTKAAIRRSNLLVTTDSGPRHFATAFGVPVLTLFGPTHVEWTRTYSARGIHARLDVPCGPCQKPTCPLKHHRCMTELSPDAIFDIALRMLAGAPIREDISPARALQILRDDRVPSVPSPHIATTRPRVGSPS